MIYISKDGRWIVERFAMELESWPSVWAVERAVLNHERTVVLSHLLGGSDPVTLVTQKTLPDAILLSDEHEAAYRWVCEQYVTRDFDRKAQVGLASILRRFPGPVVEAVGRRCKAAGHFTLPYLVAAVEHEADGEIEALRREDGLNRQIAASQPTEVPPLRRPGYFSEALRSMEDGDRFRRVVRDADA